ncbi:hypothetical protein HPB52_024512 [Rhipicephalus sanguineus]|uniref:CCHC-type domain-containing protein n=1 Tax=Rhipicephalus sanguineus TaxID=34632 RepID=A0A9D4PAK4_RHISA|nr:hypothetical protein HPB52_024512 [Rhipicephalus sanguineus]
MQTARRAKHAEDNGTPSERRVAAEDAGLRPLREVTRKTGPPLNDQMDTEDTSDDGVGARDARDDEGNAEWSLFTKRKPIRKVKPEQLRLERVRPDQTIDYIMDHLRCETATILDARRLGKTNMLLLTFNTPSPPTRLVFDYEITRVYEYKPKIIACYNCHGLGHIAKYCPSEELKHNAADQKVASGVLRVRKLRRILKRRLTPELRRPSRVRRPQRHSLSLLKTRHMHRC